MIRLIMVLAALAFSAQAQVGGYRLVDPQGDKTTNPGDLKAGITHEEAKVVTDAPTQTLVGLVAKTVNQAEAVLRREPPTNATNTQRAELLARKTAEINGILNKLPRTPAIVSVEVVDVLDRGSDETGKRMVVGKVKWQTQPVVTAADRKAIAEENRKHQEALRALTKREQDSRGNRTRSANSARTLQDKFRDERKALEEKHKALLQKMRDDSESELPEHFVYVITDDESVTSWRRGQVRNIRGVIQDVALFVYNPDDKPKPLRGASASSRRKLRQVETVTGEEKLDSAYVGLEAVIWAGPQS